MHQHVSCLTRIVDPLVTGVEGVCGVLRVAIVQVEFEVVDVLRICKVQIHPRTHSSDVVLLQFLQVVGEVITADPYLAQLSLALQHLLPLAIIGPEREHRRIQNYKSNQDQRRLSPSELGELGLTLLQERTDGLHHVLGLKHHTVGPGNVLKALINLLGLSSLDHLLDGVYAHRTFRSDYPCTFQQSSLQLRFIFKNSRDKANSECFISWHVSAGEGEVPKGGLVAHTKGEDLKSSYICSHADIDLLYAELPILMGNIRILRAEAHIGGANEVNATSDAHPMNAHQHRYSAFVNIYERLLQFFDQSVDLDSVSRCI